MRQINAESGDEYYEPRMSRSISACLFPPAMWADAPRRSISYSKLDQEPLRLTVRKLDGSTFGIEVAKAGTVGQLKRAVQAAFHHLPKSGPGRVSWDHVWGQFCLCHEGQKLLTDSDYIGMFGIKDGDQLQFVRHYSHNVVKIQSKTKRCDSDDEPSISDGYKDERKYSSKDGSHYIEDPEDYQVHHMGLDDGVVPHCEYRICHLLRVWFPYRKLSTEDRTSSSRLSYMVGSFKNCLRFSSSKYEFQSKSWKGR